MGPDGVSYLDVGDAWWRGDFSHAVNAYWSPLYSWIVGGFLKLINPSSYWRFPMVHLVNFAIYLFALAAFEIFLRQAMKHIKLANSKINDTWYLALAYSLFISTSVMMISPAIVTPDLLVACLFYLALALALKIYAGDKRRATCIGFGVVLGLGYLGKTILLPVGLVLLVSVFILRKTCRAQLLVAAAAFLLIAAPWAITCSRAEHRFTIGDSGRWNYLVWVNGIAPTYPETKSSLSRHLLVQPSIYDLSKLPGTLPLWYNPSYWQEGMRPRVDLSGLANNLSRQLPSYCILFTIFDCGLMVAFIIGSILGATGSLNGAAALVGIPSLAAFASYAPLYIEFRYLAAFSCVLWLALFLRVSMQPQLIALPIITNLLSAFIFLPQFIAQNKSATADLEATAAIEKLLPAGSAVGAISVENRRATFGRIAFVPYLADLHIVAENPDGSFLRANREEQSAAIDAMRSVGAKAVLTSLKPPVGDAQWIPLGHSGYYLLPL